MRYSLIVSMIVATIATFVFASFAFAADTVSNYVDLSTTISNTAAQFAGSLTVYIIAGLGIFVSLVLFRFGMRLLRRWVH